MKRAALLVLLLAVIGIGYFAVTKLGGSSGAGVVKTSGQASKTAGNPTVSNLSFTDIDEKVVKVDPNKKTVLHFMISTGCPSCTVMAGNLTKFADNPTVDLVSIAMDSVNDTKETIQDFRETTQAKWPFTIDKDQSLIKKFNVTSIDTVMIIYQNRIIFSGVYPSISELENVLK